MPIVDLSTYTDSSDATLFIGITIGSADLSVAFNLLAEVEFGIEPDADSDLELTHGLDSVVEFGIEPDEDSFLRISAADPNKFLAASITTGLDIGEDLSLGLKLSLQGIFSVPFQFAAKENSFGDNELNTFKLLVNIYPSVSFPANYQEYTTRFTINSTEIPIREFTLQAEKSKIGTQFSVKLSRLTDRTLLVDGSVFKLEIGFIESGVTTWHTLTQGFITNQQYNIGWEQYKTTDEVTLSVADDIATKINVSPLRPICFYDSNSLNLTDDDFEPMYDMAGGAYNTLRIPIAGLTIYSILNYAMAECGLSYITNVPNYRIKRFDIGLGQTYWQTIQGLFGIYQPLVFEQDGVVKILETSLLSAPDFDSPKQISTDIYRTFSRQKNHSDLNGYIMQYSVNKHAWDSSEDDDTTTTSTVEDIDGNKTTTVTTVTTVRKYYRDSHPHVPVRQEVVKITITTEITDPVFFNTQDPVIVNYTEETFEYDETGKLLTRYKSEQGRVPVWIDSTAIGKADGDGHWEYDTRLISEEYDLSEYKPNFYNHDTEYRAQLSQYVRALVYIDPDLMYETKDETGTIDIDPDKEVPVDYKQLYVDAYRGGNLDSEGIMSYETVKARIEKIIPVDKEMCRVETKEVDYLTNIVTLNTAEEQVGEFASNSQMQKPAFAVVFAKGGSRNNRRLEPINVGELPIEYAIPLLQRKLEKATQKDVALTAEIIGIDLAIKRGTIVNFLGRSDEDLGNYIVEGFQIQGQALGTPQQTVITNVNSQEI